MAPRPDEAGTPLINVFIDSNVWNFLFDLQIDLAVALPPDRFCLYREVELENGAIPPEKVALRAFIEATVVLSLDAKAGPISDAHRQGGMVVFLTDFDQSGLSLGDFILKSLSPDQVAKAQRRPAS